MTELHVQTHLRAGGTLDGLRQRYAITAKRHGKYNNLVLLKYNQIESPFAERIVQECRGLILDESNNWNVVARGFDKFFNHGEGHAAKIDWMTAQVQEKVDGSLCVLYHYDNRWHVATTGTPDASGDVSGFGVTFADYFWDTARQYNMTLPSHEWAQNFCWMLELTGPINRVVVRQERPALTVLGGRNRVTGDELRAYDVATLLSVPAVKSFPLQSVDDIIASFEAMDPLTQEGYVVFDGKNRIKVKHPGYVALHHAKDGVSQRAFVEIVRSGETSEIVVAFPELKPMLDETRERYEGLVSRIECDYEVLKGISEQKAFALKAKETVHSAPLFAIRAGKAASAKQWLKDVHIDTAMRMLGYKAETKQ